MKPQNNGLVELHDSTPRKEGGFFCMKLVDYLNEEAEMGTAAYEVLWEDRFRQAKAGECAYREKCPIYARSTAGKPKQLTLF